MKKKYHENPTVNSCLPDDAFRLPSINLLLFGAFYLIVLSACVENQPYTEKSNKTNLIDYVDPFIGTAGEGHVHPGATLPWGMVSVSPVNVSTEDHPGTIVGYKKQNPRIYGFSHVNLSGVGCREMGSIQIMPASGAEERAPGIYSSGYSDEVASPGFYSVRLDDYDIDIEMTATSRSGISRIEFDDDSKSRLVLSVGRSVSPSKGAGIKKVENSRFEGYKTDGLFCGGQKRHKVYFAIEIDTEGSSSLWSNGQLIDESEVQGEDIGALIFFDDPGEVLVRVGVSYVNTDNAWENLRKEQNGRSFEEIHEGARNNWESVLSKVRITDSAADEDGIKFYTALYHSLMHPNVISDTNGEFPVFENDDSVGLYRNKDRYSVFSLWDTYRTVHPLLSFLFPGRQSDMVNTMVDMYKESGWLPKWELAGNETYVMVGDPAVPVIVDTYMKGIRGFDTLAAFQAILKSSNIYPSVENPFRPGLADYLEYGYIPDDKNEVWGSVSTGLEYALADWNISQLAEAFNQDSISRVYKVRSEYYKNYYDADTRKLRPRMENGNWLVPFNMGATSEEKPWPNSGAKGFVEGNTYQYSWFVPHDLAGLQELMGGSESFSRELTEVFDRNYFALWNEPDMGYPYIFNHVKGQEWKTQKYIGEAIQNYFGITADGLPGNDDTGTLSAWLVFSMLGLYPSCPGEPVYQLTTPTFDSVAVLLEGGELLITKDRSDHQFIDSVFWNGKHLQDLQISHQELSGGGQLQFTTQKFPEQDSLKTKIEGMLYGTLIGDAMGGPTEFGYSPWRRLLKRQSFNDSTRKFLRKLFKFSSYSGDVELYKVWEEDAEAGTITDDSRWKLITINYLQDVEQYDKASYRSYVQSADTLFPKTQRGYARKWLDEVRSSASGKYPEDRLWAGVPTLMGQMALLPIAAVYPYELERAYEMSYELNFFDKGMARDLNSACVVGLANMLQLGSSFQGGMTAMRNTDPHNYSHVPWTERRVDVWLDSALSISNQSGNDIELLFSLLEERLEARQWWDAWVSLAVVCAIADFTDYDPISTMVLCVAFGHDTDSYAQLAGAFFGAIHGPQIFSEEMRSIVRYRLLEDHGEDLEDWNENLYKLASK